MPVDVKNREYRALELVMEPVAAQEGEGPSYRVVGYATTYDDPYLLWEYGDEQLYEAVSRGAIDAETDLSDVIMQYDHAGKVMARTGNGTLSLFPDDEHGLRIEADLSRSEAARQLFEEIQNGLVTRMSWAFSVDRESSERDRDNRRTTRTILHVKKVYDVSAVSIPANDATEISARTCFDGAIEAGLRESRQRGKDLAEASARLRLLRLE